MFSKIKFYLTTYTCMHGCHYLYITIMDLVQQQNIYNFNHEFDMCIKALMIR